MKPLDSTKVRDGFYSYDDSKPFSVVISGVHKQVTRQVSCCYHLIEEETRRKYTHEETNDVASLNVHIANHGHLVETIAWNIRHGTA